MSRKNKPLRDLIKNTKNIYSVILAGGSGTRFWPLSRELNPKQLLKIFGTESLIRQAILRVLPLTPEDKIYIVTNERLINEIRNHLLAGKKQFKKINYLVEPSSRNTAPAIGLTAVYLNEKSRDSVMIILPSDHVVEESREFFKCIERAVELAQNNYLVTLGLVPKKVETGFGYIEKGREIKSKTHNTQKAYKAKRFIEKPPYASAASFVKSGSYFWNSGIFIFKTSTILNEIKSCLPQLYEALEWFAQTPPNQWLSDEARNIFSEVPNISIDHGVLEKSNKIAVIEANLNWNDVGNFTALEDIGRKDKQGNVSFGNTVSVDSKNCIIYSDKRLIATLGLEDIVVIDTQDATLVCPKNRCQEVRKVVEKLKKKGAEECLSHRTALRPWGSFTVLEKGPGYKIKLIEVKPESRLSFQLHHHRSEHWIILSGTAKVTREKETYYVHAGESTFIPPSTPHRLENPGRIPLKLIEVQNGEYLEEDDIVRFSDDFERNQPPNLKSANPEE
jgi:mannose-1-phosphate guanylyltransferase/mannose-6-phosphate isomerase